MTMNVERCITPGEDQCRSHPASAHEIVRRTERDELSSNASTAETWDWRAIPLHKQLLLGLLFLAAFLISEGSSAASQGWEGAPPWYLPVGLSLAILLCGGRPCLPAVFISSVVAALVNYHRPVLSGCGIPGSIAIYLGYVGGAAILRGRWRIDLKLGTLNDVGRYIVISLGAAIFSAVTGMMTLLGDGRIRRSDALGTTIEWWVSDALAIIAFTPFLLVHVAPLLRRWLSSGRGGRQSAARTGRFSTAEILELTAQCGFVVFAIWFVFGYAPAIPYQPLYLLFVPVIWVAVRRGLPGAVLTTFAISVGMMFAAWITQAHRGSLPRLQLAMLALGLTGLCLGAVVTERKRVESTVRKSERRYRLLFERNLAGVFRATVAGRVLEYNQAAACMFGSDSPEEVLDLQAANLYDRASDWESLLTKLKSEKSVTNHEMRFRRKNGDSAWAMLNVSLIDDDSGIANIEGTLIDITERKVAEERVQSLAYYDALTGLPNRILLHDRLSKALSTARRQNNKVALLFLDLDRFKLIRKVLHETGLAAHHLELELTESLLLANADVTFSVLQELKAMGLTLAIDDFGTGYSSFSYLRQFWVSKLKIDRSFIRDVAVNPDDAAITTAIISMAKSLNLKVIAEGVENEAQMAFLRAHQCDEIQGYYFSKPLPVDKVADKLRGDAAHANSERIVGAPEVSGLDTQSNMAIVFTSHC